MQKLNESNRFRGVCRVIGQQRFARSTEMTKTAGFVFFHPLPNYLFFFLCATECNTINAFQERLSKSVHHYPYLCNLSHLVPLFEGGLFTALWSVAIYSSF